MYFCPASLNSIVQDPSFPAPALAGPPAGGMPAARVFSACRPPVYADGNVSGQWPAAAGNLQPPPQSGAGTSLPEGFRAIAAQLIGALERAFVQTLNLIAGVLGMPGNEGSQGPGGTGLRPNFCGCSPFRESPGMGSAAADAGQSAAPAGGGVLDLLSRAGSWLVERGGNYVLGRAGNYIDSILGLPTGAAAFDPRGGSQSQYAAASNPASSALGIPGVLSGIAGAAVLGGAPAATVAGAAALGSAIADLVD